MLDRPQNITSPNPDNTKGELQDNDFRVVVECNHSESKEDMETYPDGGMSAWLVVLAAWCLMIPSMGILNSIGAIQAWLSNNQLSNYSESSVGWIVSTYAFLLLFGGAQVGPVFDSHNALFIVVPGSIGMFVSLMTLSVCQEYYQFFLSFGVLGGLSAACLFTPCLAAIGHWFQQRRALATGIACTAGGIGGICFPMIIINLAPKIGFPWAIRTIAFICALTCSIGCCFLRKRLPNNKNAGVSIDLKALLDRDYGIMTIAVVFVEFAVFIPYTYIPSYGMHEGMTTEHALYLITFLNAGAVVGRAISGVFGDKLGPVNVMITTSAISAILILSLWLTAGQDSARLIAFSVIFGFWSGAAISLTPVCVGQVCETKDYGKRSGTTFSIASLGALIGIPIAGAILQNEHGSYSGLIILGGVAYMASCMAFVLVRVVARGFDVRIIF